MALLSYLAQSRWTPAAHVSRASFPTECLVTLPVTNRSAPLNYSQALQSYFPRIDVFKYSFFFFFVKTIKDWNKLSEHVAVALLTCLHLKMLLDFLI